MRANKIIMDALRAMGPLSFSQLYDELVTQCLGVDEENASGVLNVALADLASREVIRRLNEDGAWEIHPRMYNQKGAWEPGNEYLNP